MSWSAHCEGQFEYVGEKFEGLGGSDIAIGEGGNISSPYEWKAVCNDCGAEYDDISDLETKEIEIKN